MTKPPDRTREQLTNQRNAARQERAAKGRTVISRFNAIRAMAANECGMRYESHLAAHSRQDAELVNGSDRERKGESREQHLERQRLRRLFASPTWELSPRTSRPTTDRG